MATRDVFCYAGLLATTTDVTGVLALLLPGSAEIMKADNQYLSMLRRLGGRVAGRRHHALRLSVVQPGVFLYDDTLLDLPRDGIWPQCSTVSGKEKKHQQKEEVIVLPAAPAGGNARYKFLSAAQ